jgi:replicative DNA helicase
MTTAPTTTTDKGLPPHSIEVEQALLGAILTNNDAFNRVSAFLQAQHLYEPAHQQIFEICAKLIRAGKTATPITVKIFLPSDLVIVGLTASQYLARLVAEATTVVNALDYGRIIYDLALRRSLIVIGEEMVRAAYDAPVDKRPQDIAAQAVEALAEIASDGTEREGTMRSARAAMADFVEHIAALYQGTASDDSISTGLRDVDERIGGLKRGSLVVLAGRPSMGKTTFVGAIASNAGRRGFGVAFYSLEMPNRQIMPRILSDALFDAHPLSVHRLAKAKFSEADFDRIVDAQREFEKLPFVIDDSPSATIGTLLAKTQTVASRFERQGRRLDIVIVDYLKFIHAGERYSGQRHYEVGEITTGLKQLARRLNVVVLLCCQLNRQVEQRQDRRPQLSDLRESGDIEADADIVLLLFREAYYLERDPDIEKDPAKMRRLEEVQHLVEIIVAKNRNGPTDTIPARVNLEHSAVRDLDRQRDLDFARPL